MDHLFTVKDDSFKRTKFCFKNLLSNSIKKFHSKEYLSENLGSNSLNNKNLNCKNLTENSSTRNLIYLKNEINKINSKLRNELNCHKSTSSVLKFNNTLDQSADQLHTKQLTKSFNNYHNKMELKNLKETIMLTKQITITDPEKHNQRLIQGSDSNNLTVNNQLHNTQLNNLNNENLISIKECKKFKMNLINQKTTDYRLNHQIQISKLVPVYLLVKQQVFDFKFFQFNNYINNLIKLKCNLFLLLLMLFCLITPLNAMTTLLSGGGLKTKINNNNQTNNKNDQQPIVTSSSLLTPTTFTYTNSSNAGNRAVITTSPSKRRSFKEPVLLTSTTVNQTQTTQLNDLVQLNHLIHHSHSLPYNLQLSSSNHHKLNNTKNDSGIFFTSRSSNSLPILNNKSTANNTHHHNSRIIVNRQQQSKSIDKQFKQLDASSILSDLNAQASQSSLNSVNEQQIRNLNNNNNINKNDQLNAKSLIDNKMESSKRSTQIETNLPETFYQQTKKRLNIVSSGSSNGLALAQTRNPVLSTILKDVRPPSVSYSSNSVSSSNNNNSKNGNQASNQIINSNINQNQNGNQNKKLLFTRIQQPNGAQLNSYSISSSFSTNTSPSPSSPKRLTSVTGSSSTNKDTVISNKDPTTIITKDIQSKDNYKNTPTPDSVYVVHHHHLVTHNDNSNSNSNNNERQQQSVNKYTLISSTEPSSKSKNYYKNEDEDDRVSSTSSIFDDDEPPNLEKSSNTLDLSMLLKKEFDEQSNNKIIIPREQLNGQFGNSNVNLFALLPTATTSVTITPLTNTQSSVNHHHEQRFKDPSIFSTTVRSIKVDLNRNQNNSTITGQRTKPATITKLFGQRESLNDILRTTNGHSRVPQTNLNSNSKDLFNNLTNNNVVDMKQFQLNLAKTAIRENPKDRMKNLSIIDLNNNNKNNTIHTSTTSSTTTISPLLSAKNRNSNLNKQQDKNIFKYINKNQLEDNKVMDNVLNSLDNNLPNGLDASDSNQIYNRTMLLNDLKEYKERNLKKSINHHNSNMTASVSNDQDVLIRPVNEENDESLNNALAGVDNAGNRESYRLTTERLAFGLIAVCSVISIFCLIIVAFSIRCRDMCDEYKQWKNAEKLALFNYRYQQHQQQQQRNHRLKLHQMAAFGNLVSESNSSSSQLISNSSGNNAAVGALTNLSRPIFGPSCCCCPTTANHEDNKKHNNNKLNSNDQTNCPRGYFHNQALRGRLPFGAASSVFATRFNASNPLANNGQINNNENNENSLELLDEENDTLNGSLTDEFTTKLKATPHPRNQHGQSTAGVVASTSANQQACLQCTCEDSFIEDEESDLGSLSQVPTAIKNSSNQQQQYLRPNQLITTHAKHHFNSSSNVNNHHHHLNNHPNLNNNNQNKHNKRGIFQPIDNNWIQSSIVDELHRKHNHRLINGAINKQQSKYDDNFEKICSFFSVPLVFYSKNCDRLI